MTTGDLNHKMQQLKPEFQTKLNNEQQEILSKELYTGVVPEKLPQYRQFAMMHENEMSLNISFKYWDFMMRGANDTYCIVDVLTFLLACQRRTYREWLNTFAYKPEDAQQTILYWGEFRNAVKDMEEVINPVVDEVFNRLYQKYMGIQHLDISGQSHSIPKHKLA